MSTGAGCPGVRALPSTSSAFLNGQSSSHHDRRGGRLATSAIAPRDWRRVVLAALTLGAAACASAPPPAPVVPPAPAVAAAPSFEQKMAWILRLEDQRLLRDPAPPEPPPPPPPAPVVPVRGRVAPVPPPPPLPPPPPDLVRMLSDEEARIRRRAALAVGRVGLREGVQPLVELLADMDPEVRQMAAFALGLVGDARARDPLVGALNDSSPLVQASVAEALGLVGDRAAADPIGRVVGAIARSGALATPPGEDQESRRDTPAAVFRLGVTALARLNAYDALAAAVLDQAGQPAVRWWPVAFALQRIGDRRGLAALVALAKEPHPYTRAFALKGLATLKDRSTAAVVLPLAASADRGVAVEAIRALGAIGDPAAAPALLKLAQDPKSEPHLRLEAVAAMGGVRAPGVSDVLLDLLSDPSAPIRAAALRSAAGLDPDNFVTVLSGLDPDRDWTVRSALAAVLGTLPPEVGAPRLMSMLGDEDQRVIPAVLDALVKLHPARIDEVLAARLKTDDPVVRAAAARGIGQLKPANGPAQLTDAFEVAGRDAMYTARAAILDALAKYGAAPATPVLRRAFGDKDWAVRVRAATLMKQLDPGAEVDQAIRPAPSTRSADSYGAAGLINPPVSTQVFIQTDRGEIGIELAMLDAPLTVDNFIALARKGFFNGLAIHRVVPNFVVQDGDSRGDGEGGPGYTIRDELNERPYLRGTVGMALDWADTGGSQYFIATSPQPHLDAKYTAFGRVISGMEVVDQIQPADIVRQVRVWDGTTTTTVAR